MVPPLIPDDDLEVREIRPFSDLGAHPVLFGETFDQQAVQISCTRSKSAPLPTANLHRFHEMFVSTLMDNQSLMRDLCCVCSFLLKRVMEKTKPLC